MNRIRPTPVLRRTILITLLAGSMMCVAAPALAADRIMAGQYLTKTTDGKTQTALVCVSAEQAQGTNGSAEAGRAYTEKVGMGYCKVKAYDISGNAVTSTVACGESVITSRAIYHGDSFEGDITTTVRSVTHSQHVTGKRVGACK